MLAGLEAAAQLSHAQGPGPVTTIEFVIGGVHAEAPWRDWLRVARVLLGEPEGLEGTEAFAAQVGGPWVECLPPPACLDDGRLARYCEGCT